MPDVTLSYRAALFLRQYPAIHRPLRWLRQHALRGVITGLTDTVRLATAASTRIGPPRGDFAICDLLRRGEVEGRLVLEDQGNPKVPERSLQVISGMHQHNYQPWPVLWSRHRNARLVGSSLALIDERKRVAAEAACLRHYRDDPA